jgi:hypothetical protein
MAIKFNTKSKVQVKQNNGFKDKILFFQLLGQKKSFIKENYEQIIRDFGWRHISTTNFVYMNYIVLHFRRIEFFYGVYEMSADSQLYRGRTR